MTPTIHLKIQATTGRSVALNLKVLDAPAPPARKDNATIKFRRMLMEKSEAEQAAEVTTMPAASTKPLELWDKARTWVTTHLNEQHNLTEITQHVADNAEIAYMTLVAHKHLLADNLSNDFAYLSKRSATVAENLAEQTASVVDLLAVKKSTLASGLATRRAALGDATNRLASQTHVTATKVADGLAARKATIAESAPAKKASQVLHEAADTLREVQNAPIVRTVSERAGAAACAVGCWANAALDESRAFVSLQKL